MDDCNGGSAIRGMRTVASAVFDCPSRRVFVPSPLERNMMQYDENQKAKAQKCVNGKDPFGSLPKRWLHHFLRQHPFRIAM